MHGIAAGKVLDRGDKTSVLKKEVGTTISD